jgi:hypothetical protein
LKHISRDAWVTVSQSALSKWVTVTGGVCDKGGVWDTGQKGQVCGAATGRHMAHGPIDIMSISPDGFTDRQGKMAWMGLCRH